MKEEAARVLNQLLIISEQMEEDKEITSEEAQQIFLAIQIIEQNLFSIKQSA